MIFATDEWFAAADNLIKDEEPIFVADKFTNCGKWMDGWETRRKRIAGHDWCIIRLAAPCVIKGIHIDTAHFTGNYAPRISIQGASLKSNGLFSLFFPRSAGNSSLIQFLFWRTDDNVAPNRKADMLGRAASRSDFDKIARLKSDEWRELVPMTNLSAGYEESRHTHIVIDKTETVTHIRLNIFPDGGIARLRVYGIVRSDIDMLTSRSEIDLMALQNGGVCVDFSNAHYGHPRNLIKPGRGINMGDGWETARRLDRPAIIEVDEDGILLVPGNEYAIFQLAAVGNVNAIEVDTNHFKGNFPDNLQIEGTIQKNSDLLASAAWTTILPTQKLSAHRQHFYKREIQSHGPFNFVRITIAPDGGISRVRIIGNVLADHPNGSASD